MMSFTFGLFTQVSGSGPLGPLVSHVLKISENSLVLRTREFTDIFITFDEIYLVFTLKKVYISRLQYCLCIECFHFFFSPYLGQGLGTGLIIMIVVLCVAAVLVLVLLGILYRRGKLPCIARYIVIVHFCIL